jgi:hypothetical protein
MSERDFQADVDAIRRDVDKLGADIQGAASDTADQLKGRVSQARADMERGVATAEQSADQAVDQAVSDVQNSWAQMKADVKAHVQQRNAELNAAATEIDAELAEEDAANALAFADWAIGNARVAVLNALEYRAMADARAELAGV